MLTNKAKYGLKAMLFLADQPPEHGVRGADIASHENIPKKFLDLILLDLRDHGLVTAKKGVKGGYQLALPADKISVGQIVRILDGPLAPLPCVSRTAYKRCPDCDDEAACRVRRLMAQVREALSDILDNATLASMRGQPEHVLNYEI